MKEDFLQFIWKHKLFIVENQQTIDGEKVDVISTGKHNRHAGPDFSDARIRIGETLWAGNVEIHQRASDWNRHDHQNNPLYRNTILHIVADCDTVVKNDIGAVIPSLIIKWLPETENNYNELIKSNDWVNCASLLNVLDPFRIKFFLNSILIERLEKKIEIIDNLLIDTNIDWSETFYRFLLRSFGFRENNDPFEQIARSLPQAILAKHHDSVFQLEALLFGQAGLLGNINDGDQYFQSLRSEYQFLAKKYELKPNEGYLLKFMRMHPSNFPTIRLSQFAQLVHRSHGLFAAVLEGETIDNLRSLFKISASEYWETHYNFNKPSVSKHKTFGEQAFILLVINVIVPFLFLYGNRNNKPELRDRALEFLEKLPPENNNIIRHWQKAGIEAVNALESQALIHLQQHYCQPKKCLDCTIGHRIIFHRR